MKKEVILVTHSLSIGGAERHVINIANYLAEHGARVSIIPIDGKGDNAYRINDRVNLLYLNDSKYELNIYEKLILKITYLFSKSQNNYYQNRYFYKYKYVIKIKEILKNNNNAVIVAFSPIPTIVTMWAGRNCTNKKMFYEFTASSVRYSSYLMSRMIHKYSKYANAVIFQTEEQQDYFEFLTNVKKYIIPNPLYSATLPNPYFGERKKEIVNFCRLDKAKNLPLLIDAFSLLHDIYPDYVLKIYGNGNEKEYLKNYIENAGLSDCAFLCDARTDIHSYVVDSAMFVSSSDYEGISNSMIEAMAIGLPCICTDCAGGGARMMIEDHENGILVPVNDKEKMCEAMKEIIENPALAGKLSKNAIKIRDRLDPDKICSQIMDVIFEE